MGRPHAHEETEMNPHDWMEGVDRSVGEPLLTKAAATGSTMAFTTALGMWWT